MRLAKREKLLPPIRESSEDFEALEAEIVKAYRRLIYAPILGELLDDPQRVLRNAEWDDPVAAAIRSGRITFDRGRFSGRFNAEISKGLKRLGAQWDRKTGMFRIPQSSLPKDLQAAISSSRYRFEEKIARIEERLAKISPEEFADSIRSAKFFDASLWKTNKEFRSNVKGLALAPELSAESRERISGEWEKNLQIFIRDFTQEETQKLRHDLRKSIAAGNRYESAVKAIQSSYGVTRNKAKFLARQETSLMMAKFQETQYAEAGIKQYVWGCVAGSGNHPVRPSHKILEGKRFSWDDPPITSGPGEPIRRNNPGQDYNCRCFAKPIVRF